VQLNLLDLRKACIDCILRNRECVLKSGDFKGLPKEAVIFIISNRGLRVSQEDVFEAVMSWGNALLKKGACIGNNGAFNAVAYAVSDLLPHVRLGEMSYTLLYNHVKQSRVVTAELLVEVLQGKFFHQCPCHD
jgi:hypothetical protein